MTASAPSFDTLLARELAQAFASATGLGCTVTRTGDDEPLCAFGCTCADCALCRQLGRDPTVCARTHLYGMAEAERFGGRYIYFCNRGLTFFVSPIIGQTRSEARVTVGPFVMVEAEDFIACELQGDAACAPLVAQLPFVPPEQVSRLSTLLFMAVGYLNDVSSVEALRERDAQEAIQGQISAYILEVKNAQPVPRYPYDKERALLRAMADGNQAEAHRLLNELLGHILLSAGASFSHAKAAINALLVMMTRAAVDRDGGDRLPEERTYAWFQTLQQMKDMPQLCHWLTDVLNELMTPAFSYQDARHADAIHRATQYIRTHLTQRLELEDVAQAACLSPGYFSRIFKAETGQSVQQAIMSARLQKAAELIRYESLKLVEVAALTGFQDQSYFSRAFQRAYGISPSQYRRKSASSHS